MKVRTNLAYILLLLVLLSLLLFGIYEYKRERPLMNSSKISNINIDKNYYNTEEI